MNIKSLYTTLLCSIIVTYSTASSLKAHQNSACSTNPRTLIKPEVVKKAVATQSLRLPIEPQEKLNARSKSHTVFSSAKKRFERWFSLKK